MHVFMCIFVYTSLCIYSYMQICLYAYMSIWLFDVFASMSVLVVLAIFRSHAHATGERYTGLIRRYFLKQKLA